MSTTIDQRVVEMQFDNRHFEKNVSTTMSTLDKLKQKLRFKGATDGLENVSNAASKVNMSGLGSAVQTVSAKFSALEVMGVTALANLTNSAVNAGKRIVSALTIDPVRTGHNEYELKMGSIQTIMASTGEDLESVNSYLNELNEYSDKTIYSFQDMTQNIGKFTNAGVKLEDAVLAIKGISNEAAVSGATANEASRAMYNFAQALSSGYVKLIDWKSIELANMATVEFKEQLLASAVAAGTLTKTSDGLYKTLEGKTLSATYNFNDSLQDQWMTTEVLIGTLKQYADESTDIGRKATEAATQVKTMTQLFDTLKESAQSGWAQTWEIIVGDYNEAKDLFTGLSKVIGGFIDKMSDWRNNLLGKALDSNWEKLTKKIEAAGFSAKDYNKILEDVLTENKIDVQALVEEYGSLGKAIENGKVPSKLLTKALQNLLGVSDDLSGTTDGMTRSMEEYEAVVERVIKGEFGHGKARWNKLTEQGYDWAKVQNMVNEKLGSTVRHMETLTDEQIKNANSLANLSDEQLRAKGYTEEQITALKDLKKAAEEGDTSVNELIESMEKPSGRDLLIQSFQNIAEAISKPFDAIKAAWKKVFEPDEDDDSVLYNLIQRFKELTENMIISDGAAENLQHVFEGLFAIFQLSSGFISASLTNALKLLKAVLGLFDLDLMDLTSKLADYLIKYRDWIKENSLLIGSIDKVAKIIYEIIVGLDKCARAFFQLTPVKKLFQSIIDSFAKFIGGFENVKTGAFDLLIAKIQRFFTDLENWIKGLENSENIGRDLVEGIARGIKKGIRSAIDGAISMAKSIYNAVCDFFGIHSPSRLFMAVGGYLIAGLIIGLQSATPNLWKSIKDICAKVVELFKNGFKQLTSGKATGGVKKFFIGFVDTIKKVFLNLVNFIKGIDFGSIIAIGLTGGMLLLVNKAMNIIGTFADAAKGVSKMFSGIGSYFDKKGDARKIVAEGQKFLLQAKGIAIIATAIGIFAASLYLIAQVEEKDLIRSGKVLAIATGVLVLIYAALAVLASQKIKSSEKIAANIGALSSVFVIIAGAVALLAVALKIVSTIDVKQAGPAIKLFIYMLIGMTALVAVLGKFGKTDATAKMGKVGLLFVGISVAMLLMTSVIKRLAKIKPEDVNAALWTILKLVGLFAAIVIVSQFSGEFSKKAGSMIIKMAGAMLLMLLIIKIASMMKAETVLKGIAVVGLIGALFAGLLAVSKIAGKNSGKAGLLILGAAVSLVIIAAAMKLLSSLSVDELKKGLVVVTVLELLFMGLIKVTKYSGKHAAKVGVMLLLMSAALLLVVGIMTLVSKMDPEGIARGLAVVSVMELLFMGLIKSMKSVSGFTEHSVNAMTKLIVGIGILAVALVALSFIPTDRLLPAVAALTTVMLAFTFLISTFSKTLTKAKAANASAMSKPLWSLVAVIAIFAAIVAGLSFLPNPDNAIKASVAVGVLMASLAGALKVLGTGGSVSKSVIEQLKPMVIVVGILSVIVALLSFIPNPMNAIPAATAISILLLALTTSMRILGTGGSVSKTVAAQIWPLVAVVGALGIMVAVLAALDIEPSIETALALSTLLLAMSVACNIMAFIPVQAAATAAASLGTFITIIGAFIAAFGALYKIPGFDQLLSDGGTVMQLLGEAIGKFVGGIMVGVGKAMISLLPTLGMAISAFMGFMLPVFSILSKLGWEIVEGAGIVAAAILALSISTIIAEIGTLGGLGFIAIAINLSKFAEELEPFITAMTDVNPEILDGIKTLCEAILMLTGAGILDGLSRLFSIGGKSPIEKFAKELPALGQGFKGFSDAFAEVDEAAIAKAGSAASALKTLAQATAEIPNEGGLLGAVLGENDASTFGSKLKTLGTGLMDFITEIADITEADVQKAGWAGDALVAIAKAAKEIPNDGGWLGTILGENGIGDFVSQLPTVGEDIVSFAKRLKDMKKDHVTKVEYGAKAVAEIAKAAKQIPNDGGLIAEWLGDNTLGDFAATLPGVGTNLVQFANNLGDFDEAKQAAVTCGVKAVETLANIEIDGQTKLGKVFTGDNSLSTFSNQLPVVGTNLAKFVANLGVFDTAQIQTVNAAVRAINALGGLANSNLWVFAEHITGLSTAIPTFGSNIKSFVTNMPSNTETTNAITALTTFVSGIESVTAESADNAASFAESVKTIATDGVKAFVDAFSSDTSIGSATSSGEKLIAAAADGMMNKETIVGTNGTSIANTAVTGLETGENGAKLAGNSVGQGFADGISAKSVAVQTAAETLAASVPTWMREVLDINSPSKVVRKIGIGVPEGFIAGIQSLGGRVKSSAVALASEALTGVRSMMSTIASAIDSDMDTQPTIRPVLDLSNVKAGAGTIGGMFGDSTVGVMANVRSISAGMSRYNQNGSNDDIVSAIGDLKKALGNGGDTYQINGITYDDGSNIADAVQSLVRAAKVGRRV